MKIRVTKQDIKWGWIGDSKMCPVSRAIRRRLKGKFSVKVYPYEILIGDRPVLSVPEIVTDFIAEFDHGLKGKPFTFELDLKGKL